MVDPDHALVLGLLLAVLAIPRLVATYAERRRPLLGTALLLTGAAMILWAQWQAPGGYGFADIPDVLVGVAGQILN